MESLAAVFCEQVLVPATEREPVERRLLELVEQGQSAWPLVTIPPARFVAHLGEHASQAGAARAFLEAVHAGDLYLACAVCENDRAGIDYFEKQFIARVGEYVLRVTVDRDLVDEIKQHLREQVMLGRGRPPKLVEYSGKGALGGWVRITAVRTALNLLRGPVTTGDPSDEPSLSADPELAYIKARAQDLFVDAFKRVLEALEVEERTVLRLHYVEGLTMDQLSRMFKTPRSTIARRIDRVRREILAKTESLLKEEHHLSPSEIASVIRVAASQLQLTLTKIIK